MVTAAGSLSLGIDGLRTLIAASSNFQSRVGAADADAAAAHVHPDAAILEGDDDTLQRLMPLAAIQLKEHGYEQLAEGDGVFLGAALSLHVFFADVARHAAHHADSYLDFANFIGQVIDDIADVAGQDTYLAIRSIKIVQAPGRVPRKEQVRGNDYWGAEYAFSYSVD